MAENQSRGGTSPLRRQHTRPSPRKHPYERVGGAPVPLGGGGQKDKESLLVPKGQINTNSTVRSPLKNIQAPGGAAQSQSQAPQPLTLSKVGGGGAKTSSPNKTRGSQILEYLHLGHLQKKKDPAPTGPHPLQQDRQLLPGLHLQPRPHHQTHIQIYTEEEEDEQDTVGVESTKEVQPRESPKKEEPHPRPEFGVIGEHRKSTTLGFIPVDKSCVIGGGGDNILNFSSSSSMEVSVTEGEEEEEDASWNPFSSSVNVTRGVLGTLQPRGLNSSFTEKFVSRLEIKSESKSTAPSFSQVIPSEAKEKEKVKTEKEERNDENAVPRSPGGSLTAVGVSNKSKGVGGGGGLLRERISPLFDCGEYVNEILRYWAQLEVKYRVRGDYMDRQTEISHKMRTILVDWLVEVVAEYDLDQETLHLTVNYIDRFLCRMNVKRTKLQLVGAAALFIGAKFEETSPPEISDFVFVSDEAYTKQEILDMEHLMLTCLEFDLMMPTAHNLCLAYCSLLGIIDPARPLALYLVDLSLMDGDTFLKFTPSVIAGGAVALARFSFGGLFWDSALQKHCCHRKSTVIHAVRALHSAFFDAPSKSQTSLFEKYCAVRQCSVARAFIPNNGPWDDLQSAK